MKASRLASYASRDIIFLAGVPATTVLGGTSLATTLPPPTTDFSPTVTLGNMVTPPPIAAPSLMIGGFKKLLLGYLSFKETAVWGDEHVVAQHAAVGDGYVCLNVAVFA